MEPLNQEQNSNKSVDQNPQTPQFQQPEKTNKFGKHFIFLFTLLIISLVSAGLVFVINLVSDRNEEYGFEYPSDFKFSEDNPSLSLTEEQVIEEFERGLALKNETPNFERTETGYIIGGTGGNTVTTPRLVWGDMDNDGDEDVAGLYTSCGGSCGHNMFIIINNNGKAERLSYTIEGPEPFDNTGKVMVRDVFINDSLISITYSNITDQKATITYELEGDVLVLVSDARTYRNEEYGFEFKYPENWIFPEEKYPPELIVRLVDSKLSGKWETDQISNRFVIYKVSNDCLDVPWYSSGEEFYGVSDFYSKKLCFSEYGLELSMSAYGDYSKKVIDRILSTFKFTK